MSLYAIPGLMTAPTAPKSENRYQMPDHGRLAVTLWQGEESTASVGVVVVKPKANQGYETLISDKHGNRIFRAARKDGRFDYVLHLDQSRDELPEGDLQVWALVPGMDTKIISLFVPKTAVFVPPPTPEPVPPKPLETLYGTANIPSGVSSYRIMFGHTLSELPAWVMITLSNSNPNQQEMPVIFSSVGGFDRESITVAFSSPLPQSGWQVAWQVSTQLTSAFNNQIGQFLIPAGETVHRVSFTTAMASTPVIFGTIQATYAGQVVNLSHVVSDVSNTGFTVRLSSATPGNVLFNWQARL